MVVANEWIMFSFFILNVVSCMLCIMDCAIHIKFSYVTFFIIFSQSRRLLQYNKIITLQQFKSHEHNLIKRRDYPNAYSMRATN